MSPRAEDLILRYEVVLLIRTNQTPRWIGELASSREGPGDCVT